MYFEELELKNFRNYKYQKVKFHNKINLITGNNAQGKTNLIESLYMMSFGKSFRTSRDNELMGFGGDITGIKSVSIKDGHDLTVEINLIKNKKSIKLDGVYLKKISDLLENILTVIFSPDDLKIVKEDPGKRRAFMDRELCQLKPVYYDNLVKYKKVLDQRNAFLKSREIDTDMLGIWDAELAAYGSVIMKHRAEFITKLDKISRKIHEKISDGKENLKLSYESNIRLAEKNEDQCKIFLDTLLDCRSRDIERMASNRGINRDDIKIIIDDIDVRKYGSQGQQRSAALSLKLAEIDLIIEETGEHPVLLLDDVLSELDAVRREKLITSFGDIQIFITTTDIDDETLSKLPDHAVYEIDNGVILRKY